MRVEFNVVGDKVEMSMAPDTDTEIDLFRAIKSTDEKFKVVFDVTVLSDVLARFRN